MIRVSMPGDDAIQALPARLRDAFSADGAMINVHRITLRSPEIAAAVLDLGAVQFRSSSLDDVDRELAILAAGACFDAPYEAAQHEPISEYLGVTAAQRDAVAARNWTAECFTHPQRTLLTLVAAIAAHPAIPDPVFDAASDYYSDQQLVDVVVQTGFYFLIARITTVFDVPLDPPSDASVLQTARNMR